MRVLVGEYRACHGHYAEYQPEHCRDAIAMRFHDPLLWI
jgi:hypothetical protein